MNELNEELIKHPSILPLDFDISSSTGNLLLNIPLENDQINANNSDSFEPNSDSEPNFDFECDVPNKAVQDKFNNNQVESKEPFYVNIIPSKVIIAHKCKLNQKPFIQYYFIFFDKGI